MSNVRLTIAGREYTVACAPGEEAHITMLGGMIDARLADMPNLGSLPETWRFLYAALLLADELHEAEASPGAHTADALEEVARQLEEVAAELGAKDS